MSPHHIPSQFGRVSYCRIFLPFSQAWEKGSGDEGSQAVIRRLCRIEKTPDKTPK